MTMSRKTVVTTDTVHEVVLVTLCDTVWEHTTQTIRLGATGDTLQHTTVTDRLTVRDRHSATTSLQRQQRTADSLVVEVNEKTAAATGCDVEIDPTGHLTVKASKSTVFLQTVRWLTALLAILTVLLFTIKLTMRSAS